MKLSIKLEYSAFPGEVAFRADFENLDHAARVISAYTGVSHDDTLEAVCQGIIYPGYGFVSHDMDNKGRDKYTMFVETVHYK